MKKGLVLTTLILNSITNSLAYHGTEGGGGGPSLPVQETGGENLLYLLVPVFAYTFLINEILQAVLDRKYRNNSLKDSSDLMNITVALSLAATFILMFTGAFHELSHMSTVSYIGTMGSVVIVGAALNKRERVFEALKK